MPRRSRRTSSRVQEDQVEEMQEEEEEEVEFEEEQAVEEEKEEEEEEDSGKRSKSSSKSRKRQKRAKVMTESGQTEGQRRILRQNQRDLLSKITDASLDIGDKMMDVNSDTFQKYREKNNILYDKVRYTREAVLDGDNVEIISKKAARQVDQLISVPRYDATNLAKKLRSKCSIHTSSSSSFDWKTFGLEVGSCFNSMPSYCSFLNGPIEASYQPKERKKPVRRAIEEDDAEEEEVKTLTQKSKSKDENKLSAVEKQLKILSKKLKERSEKDSGNEKIIALAMEYKGKHPVDMTDVEKKKFTKRIKKSGVTNSCLVQFVMNPDSFTQTVENIFGLSFMVKKGDAEVGVRSFEDCKEANMGTIPGPWVKKTKAKDGRQQPHARQAIVSFNMQDWRDLKEAHNVTEGDIPHRGKKPRQSRVN